ncbi:Uncharacterised protein [Mycobacteroides abscessus subsp. abscessus]|nr:Uncharacterised protein [Mycobacteroides abscessus subsp. abscessus]
MVPPLLTATTLMPSPAVLAPRPPVLLTRSAVVPVAVPPLITRRSVGELSAPRKVLIASVPLVPT